MSSASIIPIHAAVLVAFRDDIPNRAAYCYRCCGDPRTDSWLTVYNPHSVDVEAAKAFHANKVQQIHARKLAAVAQLKELIGANVAAADLTGKSHNVEIAGVDQVDERMLADDIVWVHYKCCGTHEHIERIDRLWHGQRGPFGHIGNGFLQPASKTDDDVLEEIRQHRSNAARNHANKIAINELKANVKL
jgi:hypothetical protein